MKKYFMKHTTSRRGFRSGANINTVFAAETSALIVGGYVNANVLMEGDEIFTYPADYLFGTEVVAKAGDVWLHVTMLNQIEDVDGWVAQRHMGVTYMTLGENVPIEYLPFKVGLRLTADSQMRISRIEEDGITRTVILEQEPGEFVIEFVANDSNAPFIRME